jgi:hypothetical protein
MRKSFILAGFAASALMLLAVPAAADQTSVLNTSAAPQTPAAAPTAASHDDATEADLDKIVCKSQPPPTGTRLGARKTCLSVRQWRVVEEESQKALDNQQSVGSSAGKIGN